MKSLAVILIVLALIPSLFSGDEKFANFAYDVCTMPMVPIVLFYLFNTINKSDIINRGIVASLTVVFAAKFITYLSIMVSVDLGFAIYIVAGVLSYLTLAMTCAWKDEQSDIIEEFGTYFVFKRPRNFLEFIVTLFKSPVTSFSIVKDSKWYKFSTQYEGLYISDLVYADLSDYIFKRVPDVDEDLLKGVVGSKWKIKSNNCITVFKHVLLIVGIELKYFDFIPSVFAYRFFKNK